jgi:zinc protease
MSQLIQPEQIELSNGIPLILQHYDSTVAATYWWNRTGSADESPQEAGFAHFLEHMLFKDAAAKETGKGDINAYTSFDQTVYHVTCSAHHWERILDAFGTMAKPQRFLKEDFEREREVILEELRKNEDSPGRMLFQELFSQTFKKHPYGRPVIGFVKTLKAARVQALEAFYRRNYVSSKMGVILVGPIEDGTGKRKRELIRLAEKHFGKKTIPFKKETPTKRVVETPLRKGPETVTKSFDVKTPTLSISFRAVDIQHPDMPALDLMAGILGMGELSRLYQRLFYGASLVTEVSGGLYVPKDNGMLYFQAEVDELAKLPQAAEEIFKELRRICDEGPTEEELSRVVVNSESEKLYSTQTADGVAGRTGFMRFVLGDMDYDQKYLAQIRAVTPETIREVARKYLDPKRMSAVVLVPKAESKYDSSFLAGMAQKHLYSEGAQNSVSKKTVLKNSGVQFFTLPSGMRVVYQERPQSNVISVHAAALGGLRLELTQPVESAAKDWGASYMMALTWNKGTPGKDARAIATIAEGHASSIDGYNGRNSVGLQMTGLARDWKTLSNLFTEVLLEPTFADTEIQHSRRIAEDSLRSLEDHSSQLCSKLFLENLFEHHPYGKLTYGSLESLQAMNQAKLQAFHRNWIRPEKLVISVAGSVSRSVAQKWLQELDERATKLRSLTPSAASAPKVQEEPNLKAPRWVEKKLGREQSHILVGGLGASIGGEDRYAIGLMQNILGGQSGRLFIELREKKSLAYTVAPVSFEGMERGYIGTYIASATPKKDEAIAGIRKVLEVLAQKGPSPQEMKRAQEFFLGRRAMDLQGDSSLAAHYGLEALYHLPFRTEDEIAKKIRAVTPKDIQRVCRTYLIEPAMVTSVVG